jgi:hypothetical protein
MTSVQQIANNILSGSITYHDMCEMVRDRRCNCDWQGVLDALRQAGAADDYCLQVERMMHDRRSADRAASCHPGSPPSEEYEEFRSDQGGCCLYRAWEDPTLFMDAYSYWVANPRWVHELRTGAFVAAVRQESLGWLETLAAAATLEEIAWDEVVAATASVQNELVKQWVYDIADKHRPSG